MTCNVQIECFISSKQNYAMLNWSTPIGYGKSHDLQHPIRVLFFSIVMLCWNLFVTLIPAFFFCCKKSENLYMPGFFKTQFSNCFYSNCLLLKNDIPRVDYFAFKNWHSFHKETTLSMKVPLKQIVKIWVVYFASSVTRCWNEK